MTGTAAELTPSARSTTTPVGTGEPGPITREVQRVFEDALHGRSERYAEWNDLVEAPAPAHVSSIVVYDTPSATACRGRACRSPRRRSCASPTCSTASACHMVEAGFPASNPKEAEFFELLGARVFAPPDRGVRDDPPARRDAADATRRCGCSRSRFAPVCTLVGKTWSLHLEKVVRVDRDENLRMIEDSVAFLVARGQAVVYDAEHFFDGWRDDPAYALRCLRGGRRGGRRPG